MQFQATQVQIFKDDDAETIVGFYGADGDGKLRYLELSLLIRLVRGVPYPGIRIEVGTPKRVGRDCVSAAELSRNSFSVTFTPGGNLASVGGVQVGFEVDGKLYRQLKRGLEEVFCDTDLL